MALTLSLLTTRAECDEVLEKIIAELDMYQTRDGNLGYAGRQAERVGFNIAASLAVVNAEITGHTTFLTTPDLPASKRSQFERKLRLANNRKQSLTERGQARNGVDTFLTDLDGDKVGALLSILTKAQTDVKAHRDTLAA